MNRIIALVTDEGDTVLDPFCGSGTTLVAAKLLGRNSIGIDVSEEAVALTKRRLGDSVMTDSALLRDGEAAYVNHSPEASRHLAGIEYTPVQRNRGIDGLLGREVDGLPAFIRVQRNDETIDQAAQALKKAVVDKGKCSLVVVATTPINGCGNDVDGVRVVPSAASSCAELYVNR